MAALYMQHREDVASPIYKFLTTTLDCIITRGIFVTPSVAVRQEFEILEQ